MSNRHSQRGLLRREDEPSARAARDARRAAAWALALAAAAAFALPEDQEQPIRIQADRSESDARSGVAVLTGDVRVEQGTLRIEAERVTVTDRDGRLARVVAEGSADEPATFRQRLEAGEPIARARAARIDYQVAEQRIELEGGALLTQGEREFAGEVIVYDIAQGRVDARAERAGGVRVEWRPAPGDE